MFTPDAGSVVRGGMGQAGNAAVDHAARLGVAWAAALDWRQTLKPAAQHYRM